MRTHKKIRNAIISIFLISMLIPVVGGCTKETVGGAAVGAGAAGAAYEYQNKRQMDRLKEDYEAGNITKEEYERRKEQIEEGSIIY